MSVADARPFRVLTLALQKRNAIQDSLASATCSAVKLVLVCASLKVVSWCKSCNSFPSTSCSTYQVWCFGHPVDHIVCTQHDQVRIQFLLTELAPILPSVRSHLATLYIDRPSHPTERFYQNTDPLFTPTPPSMLTNFLQSPTSSNSHALHRVKNGDGGTSFNTRAPFCADNSRHANYQRRVSRSSFSIISLKIEYSHRIDLQLPHHYTQLLTHVLHNPLQTETMLSLLNATSLNVTNHESFFNKGSSARNQLYCIFVLSKKVKLLFSSIRYFSTDAHNTAVNAERLAREFTQARVEHNVSILARFLYFYTPSPISTLSCLPKVFPF